MCQVVRHVQEVAHSPTRDGIPLSDLFFLHGGKLIVIFVRQGIDLCEIQSGKVGDGLREVVKNKFRSSGPFGECTATHLIGYSAK